MPSYTYLHPPLALLAVSLVLGAFALKAWGRRGWAGWARHYFIGLLAAATGQPALGIALWALAQRAAQTGRIDLPPTAGLYLAVATLVLLAVQVAFGPELRYVLAGPPRFLRFFAGMRACWSGSPG